MNEKFYTRLNPVINVILIIGLIVALYMSYLHNRDRIASDAQAQCISQVDHIQDTLASMPSEGLLLAATISQLESVKDDFDMDQINVNAPQWNEYIDYIEARVAQALLIDRLSIQLLTGPIPESFSGWITEEDPTSGGSQIRVNDKNFSTSGFIVHSSGIISRSVTPFMLDNAYMGLLEISLPLKDIESRFSLSSQESMHIALYKHFVDPQTEKLFDQTLGEFYIQHLSERPNAINWLDYNLLNQSRINNRTLTDFQSGNIVCYIPVTDYSGTAIGSIVYIREGQTSIYTSIVNYRQTILIGLLLIAAVISINLQKYKRASIELEKSQATKELNQATLKLETISKMDPLTNLYNRTGMREKLEILFKSYKKYQTAFSIIACDVDGLKQINDQYGTAAGDHALVWISHMIKSQLRVSDLICRWDGDEFLIALSSTHYEQAIEVAYKLRNAITQQPLQYDGDDIPVTMTFGVTTAEAARTLSELLTYSTLALQHGKSTDRNAVYGSMDLHLQ